LRILVRQLPIDFDAAVAVVVHTGATRGDNLPRLLTSYGQLPATSAEDEQCLKTGHIYVAPPGQHLLVDGATLRLSYAAEENRVRPAIDPLFRSAAQSRQAGVVGVILSGNLDDGSAGLRAVRRAGGLALVQDPREASFPEMPSSAIEFALPDIVLPVVELAHRLVHLVGGASLKEVSTLESSDRPPENGHEENEDAEHLSALTCPQCNGAMWVRDLGGLLQFRCHTGHILSQQTMVSEQARMVEDALWAAARALQEQSALSMRLAERFEERGDTAGAARHRRQADVAERRASTLRATSLNEGAEPSP
jgi:two-component system chemotaxis response regulator CheB